MEWFENAIYAVAQLFWQSPSQEREIVPPERLSCRPMPGFAPMRQPRGNQPVDYGGLPELLDADTPAGYAVQLPAGYRFNGQRPTQTMVFGQGDSSVKTTLRWVNIDIPNARSLLPDIKPADTMEVKPVLWQNRPAWTAVCHLDPKAHPDIERTHQRYYLVPLKHGMLVFAFKSTRPDWLKINRDEFLAVFQGVVLTDQPQVERNIDQVF